MTSNNNKKSNWDAVFNDKTISIISAILSLLGGHLGGGLVSSKTEINHKIVKEYSMF